jgi:hypothetical protein
VIRGEITAAVERLDRDLDVRLRAVQERIAAAEEEVVAAKQQRVDLIREATRARWSYARTAKSLGIPEKLAAGYVRRSR